ncbi:6,7-dimethyl-8-ribityllumazine synthase [Companilactobacillus musae]|uniref:6,7-dimethyl-8-ribityllumazine synthase n=1 Tax=Companilactobacillus musae TaxID=1903258 RepID=UPI000E6586D7|nr:6,7-dimethyl-8-ribityllumazine synthase [Companilactobacillus musae]
MEIVGQSNGQNLRIAIVVSRFNQLVTDRLSNGAMQQLLQLGVSKKDITVIQVPGAMEIPRIVNLISKNKKYDGILALGAVVRGETAHFDYVCAQSAQGVAQTTLNGEVPVMYGILTTDNMSQALNRAGGKSGNKGAECASDVIEMINLEKELS